MTADPGVPTGLQALLAVGASDPQLREQVIEDPLAVAKRFMIALTDTEHKILGEVDPERLAQMIDRIADNADINTQPQEAEFVTLGHTSEEPVPTPPAPTGIRPDTPPDQITYTGIMPDLPRPRKDRPSRNDQRPVVRTVIRPDTAVTGSRSDLPKKGCAALATLAALGGVGACLVSNTAVTGSRPDIPISAQGNDLSGIDKLNKAQAASRDSRTTLVAVFYHAAPQGDEINTSQDLCTFNRPALAAAVQAEDLTVIHIDDPWVGVKGKRLSDADAGKYEALENPYETTLEKYGIKGKLPAVLFLAPDGTALKTLIRPTAEKKLVQALKESRGLLEHWKKRKK